MKILVVDDDPAVRRLVKRTLEPELHVEIAEADDGVTALEYLLGNAVDLVILDLSMKIIGGLETLETIRRSSKHASVPVIVMTGHADETGIRRAQRLGVTQIVAKPFSRETLLDRVHRLIGDATQPPGPHMELLEIHESDVALVVDTSPEFRALVRRELGKLCVVEEAENEFAALTRGLNSDIAILVVGETSELSSTEMFGRKVRGIARLRGVRLIATVSAAEPRLVGLYDAIITRSFVEDTFLASLAKVLGPDTLARLLFHPESPMLDGFCEQIRRTLSSSLGEEIGAHEMPPGLPAEARRLVAAVEVQGSRTGWDVRFVCAMSSALEVATRLFKKEIDELGDKDPELAVAQLVKTLAAGLVELMGTRGLELRALDVRTSVEASELERVLPPLPVVLHRWFTARDHEIATAHVFRLMQR